jgi:carbon monoxide dehydrogenase subunit G
MEVDAPVENVRAVLTDYNNLDRLNPSIKSSSVIGNGEDGAVRIMTLIHNCVMFFCKDMKKVEDVREDEQGRILVAIVPQASSFLSGHASWEIRHNGTGTVVLHHSRIEPDIAVPPLLGTAVMKSTLREEILKSFENLGCLARDDCANDETPDADASDEALFEM